MKAPDMLRTRPADRHAAARQPAVDRPSDAGVSLVEVIVALFVFAIISVGIITAIVTVIRMTADNASREVATNLAAQDMDAVRAIGDPFSVPSTTTTTVVGGRTYTAVRTTAWVTNSGTADSCGSATSVFSLRIDVAVRWTGQLATTQPVRSDTILAPIGRLSDPSLGAISVSVLGANGPASGVSVTITPTSGGAALATQPPATDADGCTYATKVAPGTYSLTLSRSNSLDINQVASPVVQSVVVTAGATNTQSFQYDYSGTLTPKYASNFTVPAAATAPALPSNLGTWFVPQSTSIGQPLVTTSPVGSVSVYPFTSGYTAVAGALGATTATGCKSVDPSQWLAGTSNGVGLLTGTRGAVAAATPGGDAVDVAVPMGVATITATSPGYLTAVSATPTGAGNPGCATTSTYTFDQVLKAGAVTVALPYGSWTLYSGASAGAKTTQIPAAQIAATTNAAPGGVTTSGGTVITTLDPRSAG